MDISLVPSRWNSWELSLTHLRFYQSHRIMREFLVGFTNGLGFMRKSLVGAVDWLPEASIACRLYFDWLLISSTNLLNAKMS
ncbi:uncharacterized protein [Palaemon carinicauda]|uniref:uncharacterized protein isoform X3 n=1 Tax=Palaemon carinicauda TaxID=392227 RepID=UPI0035B63BED